MKIVQCVAGTARVLTRAAVVAAHDGATLAATSPPSSTAFCATRSPGGRASSSRRESSWI